MGISFVGLGVGLVVLVIVLVFVFGAFSKDDRK
jgi:hypothetical protein